MAEPLYYYGTSFVPSTGATDSDTETTERVQNEEKRKHKLAFDLDSLNLFQSNNVDEEFPSTPAATPSVTPHLQRSRSLSPTIRPKRSFSTIETRPASISNIPVIPVAAPTLEGIQSIQLRHTGVFDKLETEPPAKHITTRIFHGQPEEILPTPSPFPEHLPLGFVPSVQDINEVHLHNTGLMEKSKSRNRLVIDKKLEDHKIKERAQDPNQRSTPFLDELQEKVKLIPAHDEKEKDEKLEDYPDKNVQQVRKLLRRTSLEFKRKDKEAALAIDKELEKQSKEFSTMKGMQPKRPETPEQDRGTTKTSGQDKVPTGWQKEQKWILEGIKDLQKHTELTGEDLEPRTTKTETRKELDDKERKKSEEILMNEARVNEGIKRELEREASTEKPITAKKLKMEEFTTHIAVRKIASPATHREMFQKPSTVPQRAVLVGMAKGIAEPKKRGSVIEEWKQKEKEAMERNREKIPERKRPMTFETGIKKEKEPQQHIKQGFNKQPEIEKKKQREIEGEKRMPDLQERQYDNLQKRLATVPEKEVPLSKERKSDVPKFEGHTSIYETLKRKYVNSYTDRSQPSQEKFVFGSPQVSGNPKMVTEEPRKQKTLFEEKVFPHKAKQEMFEEPGTGYFTEWGQPLQEKPFVEEPRTGIYPARQPIQEKTFEEPRQRISTERRVQPIQEKPHVGEPRIGIHTARQPIQEKPFVGAPRTGIYPARQPIQEKKFEEPSPKIYTERFSPIQATTYVEEPRKEFLEKKPDARIIEDIRFGLSPRKEEVVVLKTEPSTLQTNIAVDEDGRTFIEEPNLVTDDVRVRGEKRKQVPEHISTKRTEIIGLGERPKSSEESSEMEDWEEKERSGERETDDVRSLRQGGTRKVVKNIDKEESESEEAGEPVMATIEEKRRAKLPLEPIRFEESSEFVLRPGKGQRYNAHPEEKIDYSKDSKIHMACPECALSKCTVTYTDTHHQPFMTHDMGTRHHHVDNDELKRSSDRTNKAWKKSDRSDESEESEVVSEEEKVIKRTHSVQGNVAKETKTTTITKKSKGQDRDSSEESSEEESEESSEEASEESEGSSKESSEASSEEISEQKKVEKHTKTVHGNVVKEKEETHEKKKKRKIESESDSDNTTEEESDEESSGESSEDLNESEEESEEESSEPIEPPSSKPQPRPAGLESTGMGTKPLPEPSAQAKPAAAPTAAPSKRKKLVSKFKQIKKKILKK